MQLEEHLKEHELDQEYVNYIARKFLKEVLDQCEKHDIDKHGLIKEIESGIEDHYLEEVMEADNQEYFELYIEKMALIGKKRIELEAGRDLEKEDMQEYPRKIVEHQLKGCEL